MVGRSPSKKSAPVLNAGWGDRRGADGRKRPNERADTGRMSLFNDTAGSGYKCQKLQKEDRQLHGRLHEDGTGGGGQGNHSSEASLRTTRTTQGHTWVGGIPSNADLDGWTGPTASQQPGEAGEGRPVALRAPGRDRGIWSHHHRPAWQTSSLDSLPLSYRQRQMEPGIPGFLTTAPPLRAAVTPSRTSGPLCLPQPTWGQVRKPHPFVGGRGRACQNLSASSGEPGCGELVREKGLDFAGELRRPRPATWPSLCLCGTPIVSSRTL